MYFVFLMIFVTLLVEATTNIISKSAFFEPFREYLFNHSNSRGVYKFFHTLLDCSYCTSVWVSMFYMIMVYIYLKMGLPLIIILFFLGIFFHRISNIVHHLIDRLDEYH